MQKKRPTSSLLVGLALLLAAQHALALGWARAQQTAVLGQPLDFAAALRLDPGDTVAPECVSAEVSIGDQRLPPPGLRLQVDSSNPNLLVMHVRTLLAVDEPVAAVTLAIGCPAHMSRQFVLLVDPPALVAARTLAAAAVEAAPAADVEAAPTEPPARAAPAADQAPPVRPAPSPRRAARPEPRAAASQSARKPPSAARPASPAAPVARLKLEPVEAPVDPAPAARAVDEALAAVALAASAARAAASAASSAEQRIAALESSVRQLRAEAEANRELVVQLHKRAAVADRVNGWLIAALIALTALAAWLGWRLRGLQLERDAAWRRAVAADAPPARAGPPTSQIPLVTSEIPAPLPPAGAFVATVAPSVPLPARPALVRAEPVTATERTAVLPPAPSRDEGPPRDVSIEELLDLEQQAEFFIVLGQEEAALDLLVDHLRDTGGGSPLPYLKLLEIYRRRDEREAYERIRARFNHRFNAYAPDWDADLQQGRSLDDYPGVLPRLQQVWPRPLDAMAELEALLFRKSRGELFELPAYREVLFLYSLARDLLDRQSVDSGSVDLLLPLADGGEFGATAPHPYFGLERDSVFDTAAGDRPTAPIDFDLSQPEEAAIVKPLSPI